VWRSVKKLFSFKRDDYWTTYLGGTGGSTAKKRRALIVGIDDYPHVPPLNGCVADANEMARVLSTNWDGSPNFACQLLTNPGSEPITRSLLLDKWRELFNKFDGGDALFYFSGHGFVNDYGGYLVTHDGRLKDPGAPMNDLLTITKNKNLNSITIIIDACDSGAVGNPPVSEFAQLQIGMSIVSASLPKQAAVEVDGRGVFTELVVGALEGGAADIRGRVALASVYSYAESVLGPWEQRPMYKAHESNWMPIRHCAPRIEDEKLRLITKYFSEPTTTYQLDPSYEWTTESAKKAHTEIFSLFKDYQIAGLLEPFGLSRKHKSSLYWAAMESQPVRLTALGQFYWRLVKHKRI
jgi:Caspase domain